MFPFVVSGKTQMNFFELAEWVRVFVVLASSHYLLPVWVLCSIHSSWPCLDRLPPLRSDRYESACVASVRGPCRLHATDDNLQWLTISAAVGIYRVIWNWRIPFEISNKYSAVFMTMTPFSRHARCTSIIRRYSAMCCYTFHECVRIVPICMC